MKKFIFGLMMLMVASTYVNAQTYVIPPPQYHPLPITVTPYYYPQPYGLFPYRNGYFQAPMGYQYYGYGYYIPYYRAPNSAQVAQQYLLQQRMLRYYMYGY